MNYYNPYFYSVPSSFAAPKVGLFSRLFGGSGITLSGILNGTQKALNFANQAIPLVKQVRPMRGNAKTMFKVMNEFKKVDTIKNDEINPDINTDKTSNLINEKNNDNNINNNLSQEYNNGPTFFI